MRFTYLNKLAFLCLLLVTGCSTSPPTNYYVLDAEVSRSLAQLPEGVSIGIGPVEISPYLDRNQIVSRTSQSELHLSEEHQWSEPLKTGIARAVMVHVAEMMNTNQIFEFPGKRPTHFDYQIPIDILKFEGNIGGEVLLVARWRLVDKKNGIKTSSKVIEVRKTVGGPGYDRYVLALNASLEDLAKQISSKLQGQ